MVDAAVEAFGGTTWSWSSPPAVRIHCAGTLPANVHIEQFVRWPS